MYKSRLVAMLLLLSINLLGQKDYGFLPPVNHTAGAEIRSSMCVANPSTDIPWDRTRSFADQVNDAIDGENSLFGTSFGDYVHPNYDPADPLDISAKVLAELRRVYGMPEINIEYDQSLMDLATDHSCAMDLDDTFCHTCPSDGTFSNRVRSRIGNGCFQYISENIAWITTTDVEISILRVIFLMFYADVACCDNGHRDNFLNCNYNQNSKIGFGIIRGDLRASSGQFFDAWIMTWDYLTYWSYPDCGSCNCGVSIGTPLCEATAGVVLPVELLSFEISDASCNQVMLNWSTATEQSNDYFTIERSEDGNTWTEIQVINGAGDSHEVLEYSHVDNLPEHSPKTIYYRMKQTDFDGAYTFSDVISFENDCELTEISIQPNPATSLVTIISNRLLAKVDLYSISGQQLANGLLLQNNQINIESLRSGVYIISVEMNDGSRAIRRLIKR